MNKERAARRGMSRREFLTASAGAGMGVALSGLIARGTMAQTGDRFQADGSSGGYGPLSPKSSENDGVTYLALPEDFKYTVFGRTGTPMSDGRPTPPLHDGMAAFLGGAGNIRLVRNHEDRTRGAAIGGTAPSYDPVAPGGTTTLVVDPETRLLKEDYVSLSGTSTNCAGGPTPWGSWLTCEETTEGETQGFSKDHGYVFEVPATSDGPVEAVPLKEMGRFVHEAVAIDPSTGIVYETEDRGTAGFYRFRPERPGNLKAGGQLQMLAIKGKPRYDTRTGQQVGEPLPVRWVDIENPDPQEAETNDLAVYEQGYEEGGATFARIEGAWYSGGSIFFNSTSGGDQGLGQVWQYRLPRRRREDKLILIFESSSPEVLNSPDNLCVSPRGGLALCEDSDESNQYVRGLTREGKIFDFARNEVSGFEDQEFAGATFSPDGGKTLFVNIQTPGLTFAIWGPWKEGAL